MVTRKSIHLFLLIAFALLFCFSFSGCGPAFRSVKIKTAGESIYIEADMAEYKDGQLVVHEPPSADDKRKINERITSVSNKYKAKASYEYSPDSLSIIWKLYLPDMNDLNNFIFDMAAGNQKKRTGPEPLDVKVNTTIDSVFITVLASGEALYKKSLISIQTPSPNAIFMPSTETDLLLPSKVAPNKMEYIFYPENSSSNIKITCSYKKEDAGKTILLEDTGLMKKKTTADSTVSDDKVNLFGIKDNYWYFWCAIIGAIAAIIGVAVIFKKRSK